MGESGGHELAFRGEPLLKLTQFSPHGQLEKYFE